jgi:hypothetical protein
LASFLLANNWKVGLKHKAKKTLSSFLSFFSSFKLAQEKPNFIHYKPIVISLKVQA